MNQKSQWKRWSVLHISNLLSWGFVDFLKVKFANLTFAVVSTEHRWMHWFITGISTTAVLFYSLKTYVAFCSLHRWHNRCWCSPESPWTSNLVSWRVCRALLWSNLDKHAQRSMICLALFSLHKANNWSHSNESFNERKSFTNESALTRENAVDAGHLQYLGRCRFSADNPTKRFQSIQIWHELDSVEHPCFLVTRWTQRGCCTKDLTVLGFLADRHLQLVWKTSTRLQTLGIDTIALQIYASKRVKWSIGRPKPVSETF